MAKILRHVNLFCTVVKQTKIAEDLFLIEAVSFWNSRERFTFLHNRIIFFDGWHHGIHLFIRTVFDNENGQNNIEQAVVSKNVDVVI